MSTNKQAVAKYPALTGFQEFMWRAIRAIFAPSGQQIKKSAKAIINFKHSKIQLHRNI